MIVNELASGPLDIIGDVHGEIDPLRALLKRLGYDELGRHPEGRHLVFVGDLTDRGPDSPAVVTLVAGMIREGSAQCVMGNHELNILRKDQKEGNSWFFGEQEQHEDGAHTTEKLADERIRDEVEALFGELPLALEREDLRVTHACWQEDRVSELRGKSGSVVSLSQRLVEEIDVRLEAEGLTSKASAEGKVQLGDRENRPPMLLAKAEYSVRRQNEHAVKVLTSGIEEIADEPFWAGGRWRFERRVRWWQKYAGPVAVVGHYWRSRSEGVHLGKGVDLFADTSPSELLGNAKRVMVVDYSIGKRGHERHMQLSHKSALAAFQWPEARTVFSD